MLKTYETICITKVTTPDEQLQGLVEKCKNIIEKEGTGKIIAHDDWGRAKLAYPIQKEPRGRWTYLRYQSNAAGVDEVARNMKINENVLRVFTARAAEDGSDYEPIKNTMATDLQDREKFREWREDRGPRRGGPRGGRGRYSEESSAPKAVEAAPEAASDAKSGEE